MSPIAVAAGLLVLASLCLLYWTQEERFHAQLRARSDTLGTPQTPDTLGTPQTPGTLGPGDVRKLVQYTECVLASMTSGVLVVDTLGRITVMNAEAESILGCGKDELLGRSLFEVPLLFRLPGLVSRARTAGPATSRSSRQYEVGLTPPDAPVIPLGVSVNALLAGDEAVMGYVLVCRNLTETKALMADLEHSRKLSVLGTVASGVAHNFNNILTTILGRVQLLLRFPMSPDKVSESMRIIEKCALDGAATVKRIRDFTQKEQHQLEVSEVDVNEIIGDVVAFTRARWQEQAREKGLTYDVRVEPGAVSLPLGWSVKGSSSELREVLINLMLNAIDAMPRGGSIRIFTDRLEANVRIHVVDDGPGMPADVRARIFDPFFTTKGRQGTGLGLFESANIVQRHRGRLLCESEPGRGTTFTIELPATGEQRG